MKILVTGGAGYIGSHTVLELQLAGHEVVAVDNLVNACEIALERVAELSGKRAAFYRSDVRDAQAMERIFSEHPDIACCIHFAGLKAVGESVKKPLEYYENNLGGTLTLLDVMKKHNCKNIIFSSSATVYGNTEKMPVTEEAPKGRCTNPYGWTKWMIEEMLTDLHAADPDWNVVLLRYFNPIGAHESGLIGENPNGIPNNLMPYITQVAVGKLAELHIFGKDYPTPDGTGVRDYIHVVDLAKGHVQAIEALLRNCGVKVYNLGTGRGCSVLELVNTFAEVSGMPIPYVFDARREGDVAVCYSDPSKAERELGWKAELGIAEMCRDSWNWQRKNPEGYK